MDLRQAEHWKLFYDTTKALFVLDDMLFENYNWYYQELFYIKLFSFLDESPNYITKCKEEFGNSRLMKKWLQHVLNWRNDFFDKLSTDEIIYIQYRRVRAAHMFQNKFEYDANDPTYKELRIICKSGGRKKYALAKVNASIKNVESNYCRSDELDEDLGKKIHSILHKIRIELNNIYNSSF